MARSSATASYALSALLSLLVALLCVAILFILAWFVYADYMVMNRPLIGMKTDVGQSLGLLQSFVLLRAMRETSIRPKRTPEVN